MQERPDNYTVEELIEQLRADASWEADPVYREKTIGMLINNIFPNA